jgi:predicted RNA-binding Zn ribbon-like protein
VKRQDAPGELELVRDFVNTLDLELGTDRLATPRGLHGWLVERELIEASDLIDQDDHSRAVEMRESLRALARANCDRAIPRRVSVVLDQIAMHADVRLHFRADGTQTLAPLGTGTVTTQVLGRILAIVGLAFFEGTWRRLKVCPAEDCQYAFYDHSKNRSGQWCQMAECGNRAKARTFRARHVP